jgi:TIGR03009 family protein
MRIYGVTLAAALLTPAALLAQQGGAALDPAKNKLDDVLLHWERAMKGVTSLTAQLNRTTVQKTFQATDVFEGIAKYRSPNLALLYMRKRNRPEVYEKYICTGDYLYQYVPLEKVIRVSELPKPKEGQVADDNLLAFLFGKKAAEAKNRYEITLLTPGPNDKVLQESMKYYHFIMIKPKTAADRADFARARLVLSNTTYLPRQLWFEQPDGNEVTWDFLKLDVKTEVKLTEFAAPATPAGWKLEKARRENAPRVIRPNR